MNHELREHFKIIHMFWGKRYSPKLYIELLLKRRRRQSLAKIGLGGFNSLSVHGGANGNI